MSATDRAKSHVPSPRVTRIQRVLHWASLASLAILLLSILFMGALRVYPVSYLYPSLPRVTRTSDGSAGDPLNVILVGSAFQITASFTRAGWLIPDPITPKPRPVLPPIASRIGHILQRRSATSMSSGVSRIWLSSGRLATSRTVVISGSGGRRCISTGSRCGWDKPRMTRASS